MIFGIVVSKIPPETISTLYRTPLSLTMSQNNISMTDAESTYINMVISGRSCYKLVSRSVCVTGFALPLHAHFFKIAGSLTGTCLGIRLAHLVKLVFRTGEKRGG